MSFGIKNNIWLYKLHPNTDLNQMFSLVLRIYKIKIYYINRLKHHQADV